MKTSIPADTKEPDLQRENFLILEDDNFNSNNVCIVTGAGSGIGRATAVAAAVNKLSTVGLDINEEEGKKTQAKVRELGGRMTFIKTDLLKDEQKGSVFKDVKEFLQDVAKGDMTAIDRKEQYKVFHEKFSKLIEEYTKMEEKK